MKKSASARLHRSLQAVWLAGKNPSATQVAAIRVLQALDLPFGIERQVHQNRLLKIVREGGQMTATDLAKFEP